jgi:hypothetical protein
MLGSAMRPTWIHFAVAVTTTALLLPATTRAVQSEVPELTSYMGIRFQNTTLQGLMERFGKSALFDPPGEVLVPDEVCYQAQDELKATFFIEHYGRNRSASTVTGVELSRHADSDGVESRTETASCAVPKVTLSECIGRLCLGNSIEHVMQVMRKEMTYPGSYEWIYYDVHLSSQDLVVGAYRDATQSSAVPDWMYPSHIVRVQISSGIVTALYVEIDVDMV